jgi:aminopeptidase-like protein
LNQDIGSELYNQIVELFPIDRSLTGEGVRETLKYFRKTLPELTIYEVPTGTKAFDWTIPNEWKVTDAYIADLKGNQLISFKKNNLHLVGYSIPIDKIMNKSELEAHLYSLPNQRNAIPYITSYYTENWGFCLSQNQRDQLGSGPFHVVIQSQLFLGSMSYGELVIQGESKQEILLTTYVCHPSMASNELSGPVILTALAQWLKSQSSLRYTYRILFLVETIGSVYYLSQHIKHLKENVIAGWVLTCLGDDRAYSYLPSRFGNTLTDRVSRKVLKAIDPNYLEYTWLERGSDERQFCAPGVDLPVGSIMRSKYAEYPEYHTSLDNLDFVSPAGLQGSYFVLQKVIETIESQKRYKINVNCEPQLGKRGLYPALSTKESASTVYNLMNVISYLDGRFSTEEIAEFCNISISETEEIITRLLEANLIENSNSDF